ncbi:MAG TPA: hypothetical protein VLJ59_04510 [Mycobacteriales bacterium]|nr:hypothetical protein [Mycobacteriales bacterium]
MLSQLVLGEMAQEPLPSIIDAAKEELRTTAPVVEPADRQSRALALRLLKEAIERSPGTVHRVLQEVLDLPADRLEELRELLERSTLSAVSSAAHEITDRLDFLVGLEEIVFDAELRDRVRERSQLHRILANETWIFREEYALTGDDVTLRVALRNHIHLLGRDDLAPADLSAGVLDEHGRRVVVDIMLSRVVEQRRNHREHIVIEL